jgi:thiol-disulfide isomerase/thioredoxin
MKPFTKGALVSALWWVPIGIVLALALQAAAVMLFGYLIASGNGPDWLRGMGLQEVKFHSIDSERDHGPFDYDWTVRTLDGVEVPMEEFRGKVIFLNQWATWCMPCVMEMPSIDKLYRSIDPQEVAFVLVTDEDAEEVRDFLDGKEWDLPIYLVEDEVPEGLASESIPYTTIVNPEGRIRFTHGGSGNYDTDSAREFLRTLTEQVGTATKRPVI